MVPVRSQYGDTMKCEADFRSAGREQAHADAVGRMQVLQGQSGTLTSRRACITPRGEAMQALEVPRRSEDPLDPRYIVHLPTDTAGTSLHCRWTEERQTMGDVPPATEGQVIGRVPGSEPRTLIRDNNEPQ